MAAAGGAVVCDTQLVGRRRAVPVVYVQGSHYDVGFDVGRIFGSLIKEFLATYENLRDFEREARTENGRQAYDVTLTNMKTRFPYYVKEIQGVADGAGVPFFQLFLLQMDDLIGTINENHIPRNDSGGCSSIGVNIAGKAVLGHTEDAFAETLNHFYILSAHVIPTAEDQALGAVEERFASLCYAGHLPGYTMGYNEHGLVFSINTLSPLVLKPGHTPRTFITRALLSSKCLSDAHRILQDEGLGVGNGFSVNMLWSEPDGGRQLLNVEVAPDPKSDRSMLSTLKYDKEPLMHCNLYLRLPVTEVIGPIIDSSRARMQAIRRHKQPQGRKDVKDILSDKTGDQFQVFQDRKDAVIKTIAAAGSEDWLILVNSSGTVVCDTQLVGRRRSVPVVYVQGSHYDVGFDVGRIFGSLIKEFLATYENLRDFEREARTENGRQAYDVTLTNMKTRFPYYVKEIQGVADGAGVPFFQLFLLQMDDLIGTVNENHEPRKNSGGCSSIGVNVAGKAVLGHTEDAFAATLNHFYILSAHVIPTPEDKAFGAVEERFASLCYAGHLPGYTMGYNEHGLVFSINTLSPLVLKPGHTPRTFLARALLSSKCLSDAHRILQDEGLGVGNGFSVNMLWSEPDGGRQLLNVEVAPDPKRSLLGSMLSTLKYDKEPLMHCNLYLRLPVAEVIGPIIDSSKVRMEVIRGYAQPQGRKDVEDILSDNTGDQFQVFQDRKDAVIKTIAAGIFDLEEKTWSIYINEPNASEPVAILPIRFLF